VAEAVPDHRVPECEGFVATDFPPGRERRVRSTILVLCIVAVFGFYLRCGWSYDKSLDPAPVAGDFQNLQADGFLNGQLSLKLPVPDGLKRLPDPYDPVANAPFRQRGLHDLSFYRGKLYTYFGPSPVVLLFIPFRLLHVGDLSTTLACLIFCFGGYLASVGVFFVVVRRFLSPLSIWAEATAVLALGFAAPMGWLVSIGRGYETAIASGYFLVFSGLFFLARGLFSGSTRPIPNLALGTFSLAAAVGARPNLVLVFGFVLFALGYLGWGENPPVRRRAALAAIVVPYLAVGLLLAWYNWARFGSVTEVGTSYQLLGENFRLARANELGFLRRGLFEFVLSPARMTHAFPWFRLRPLVYPLPTERNYLQEPVAGLLPNMPACVLGVVAFCSQPLSRLRRLRWLSVFIGLLAGTGFAIVALSSYHFHGATMRYQMDYAPILLLASVLGWFMAWQRVERPTRLHHLLKGLSVAVVVWSAFFAVVITTYPCAGTGSC